MTEREALTLSGIALVLALLSAIWFEQTSWPGAGLLGLVFAAWSVFILLRYGSNDSALD